MAATLVGEAAIRIVPSLRGFKTQANTELQKTKLDPVRVRVHADTKEASAHIDEWRAKEDLKGITVPIKANTKSFERDLKQIEHRVRDSPLHQLTTFNIKILGLDALPALAYAAASAAAGLDALGEAALAIPGILGGVGASVGALALGFDGIKQAMSQFDEGLKTTSQHSHMVADDNRTLERSYRTYRDAVRDTTREIQDLNAENRRSSLNKADAALSVQEAADALRQGGSTVTEQLRLQIRYAEAVDHYNDVLTKSNRTQEDANRANADGVAQSDKVVSALDSINKAVEKLDNDQIGNFGRALQNLSPNAQEAVTAIMGLRGAYTDLRKTVQDNLFAGMGTDITNLANQLLPSLKTGLSNVATGLNHDFHAIFASLGTDQSKGLISRIMGNDSGALENLSKGIQPLVDGVLKLVATSSDFLPRLGTAMSTVFSEFDAWTDKISKDGSLKDWINQGLDAMKDLGNIGLGIIGVIHKIGQAFDDVSGHQGGFLKTFADEMGKLNDELGSPEGMAKLEGYLTGAKNEFNAIRKAWDDAKPTVEELVGYAREFSAQTFGLVGNVVKAISAFDRLTGAVKPLLEFFLFMKTAKLTVGLGGDFVHMLNAPQRNIQSLRGWWDDLGQSQLLTAQAAAKAADAEAAAGDAAEVAGTKMDTASTRAKAMTTNVTSFVSPARAAADNAKELGSNADRAAGFMENAGGAASTTSDKIKDLGDKAKNAAEGVGGNGPSLGMKLKDLAGMVGPGLALSVGIVAVTSLIDKLGESHRNAARDAQAEADALGNLKNSLDGVTGAYTTKTAADDAQKGQSFPLGPGVGNRNMQNDVPGSGLGLTYQQGLALLDPKNKDQRNAKIAEGDQKAADDIAGMSWYGPLKGVLDEAHIDSLTIAKAMNNDPDALAKVDAFMAGNKNRPKQERLPDLRAIQGQLGDFNASTTTRWLRQVGGQHDKDQAAIQGANSGARGNWKLNPKEPAFGDLHVTGVTKDQSLLGVISIDGPLPNGWAPGHELPGDRGTVEQTGPNTYQVHLSDSETNRLLIPGFSQGGLIRGPGTGTSDSILAKVSDREHITKAAAVSYYSPEVYDAMNRMAIPAGAIRSALNLPHHQKGGMGGGSFKMDPALPPPKPGYGDPFRAAPAPAPAPVPAPAPGPDVAPPNLNFTGSTAPAVPGVPAPIGVRPVPGLDMSGSGALPDLPAVPGVHGATGASAAPNAPIIPQANILQYLRDLATGNGLRAGSGPGADPDTAKRLGIPTHDNDGMQHSVNRAMDIGSGDQAKNGQVAAFVNEWMNDPTKVASTRQLIYRDPTTGQDYGIINGRRLTGKELEDVYGSDLGNHTDHVHMSLQGVPVDAIGPDGFGMPGAGGFPDSADGVYPGGVPGSDMDPTKPMGIGDRLTNLFNPQNMLGNIQAHYAEAYEPKNIMKFLGGQAQMAGQSIMQIGTQFFGGLTGINLAPLLGDASTAGNAGLGLISPTQGGTPGSTDLTNAAAGDLSQFTGAGGLGIGAAGIGAPGSYGSPSGSGGAGGDAKAAMQAQIQQLGKQYGLTDTEIKMIMAVGKLESNWSGPGYMGFGPEAKAVGMNFDGDPSGAVSQFFAQFMSRKGKEGNPSDPNAVADYIWHTVHGAADPSYGSKLLGIFNSGSYAKGGVPEGKHAWVSNGEYLSNGAATSYYGADVYNAMNSMAVPKSSIVGSFAGGDFPVSAPPRALIQPPPKPPVIPDIPNINVMSDQAQSALGALGSIGGALGGAGAGASAGAAAGGAAGGGASPTAPTKRLGPPQTSVGAPPAPGASTDLPGPGGVVTSNGSTIADSRGAVASVGAAPRSNDNLNPAIKGAVAGAINSVAGLAASAAGMAGSAFGGPAGGAAGGAAGSLISGAGQVGAEAATDALNVLAGFAVKNQGPANGTALVPQRKDVQMAAPVAQRVHNGDVYTQNLHEWHRAQETQDAQTAMPYIQKYG